ncbi:ABC-ATPase domain-containing protein [Petroclostridium sp. X23]|nr:ABC-ATPase domain-containing protein [Petroclostridium sp. X23]WHH61596.1 ABC-ATPase domain-containing protein [Petroclostridium sp. X23]
MDHVQSDPFAPPSRVRIRVAMKEAAIPKDLYKTKTRKTALEDFFTRNISSVIRNNVRSAEGTGKSGRIEIMHCGQEVIERTSVIINDDRIEVRLSMGLPARGRTIMGNEAERIIFEQLPRIALAMLYENIDQVKAEKHVKLAEDQEYLREKLQEKHLVAFVANGSILPRESGISDKPLRHQKAISFKSPEPLEVEFILPNYGGIKGMGVKEGITLIVGGGFHGKSTLLKAIERGVYNHICGDGREFVITAFNAVKVRAEDGRFVEKVDISTFINNLPGKQDTKHFSTDNASGSTSQAANIMEAIEAGSKVILLDEDTSATNFMIRDARMQRLVHSEKEPITPFIDRVRQLYDHLGISTILVVGGSGDYFDVADTVIMMDEYRPYEVTSDAKAIAGQLATNRSIDNKNPLNISIKRIPMAKSFDIQIPKEKVKSKGTLSILYGCNEIDLQSVEQLIDSSQTTGIGLIIKYMKNHYVNGNNTLMEILKKVYDDIEKKGIDVISSFNGQHPGDYALPRIYETAAAINRLRTLIIKWGVGSEEIVFSPYYAKSLLLFHTR